MAQNYYSVLGVDKNATQDEIKRAFRRQAKRYHPDANPNDPQAEERFKEINEAYETLGDPEKRRQYDMFGHDYARQAAGGPPPGYGGASTFTPEDLQDILNSFMNFGRTSQRGRSPLRGQDIEQPVQISLYEAYHGTERILNKGGRQLRVSIPAGATDGTRVRVAGEGGLGANGGMPGDLYLVVELAEDPQFKRDGYDLTVDVNVDMFTAMLGGEVQVPTLGRPLKLKIPPGTQSGRKFRLAGKGMPSIKGSPGDLYARINITVPERLTPEQRRLVEQLRDSLRAS